MPLRGWPLPAHERLPPHAVTRLCMAAAGPEMHCNTVKNKSMHGASSHSGGRRRALRRAAGAPAGLVRPVCCRDGRALGNAKPAAAAAAPPLLLQPRAAAPAAAPAITAPAPAAVRLVSLPSFLLLLPLLPAGCS